MGTWGALAAYLQKYAADQLGHKWKAFLIRDMVNSNLAAILTFWATQHFGVPKAIEAICYTLAGYGGARFMEYAYNRWVAGSTVLVNRAYNIPQETPMVAEPVPMPAPMPPQQVPYQPPAGDIPGDVPVPPQEPEQPK